METGVKTFYKLGPIAHSPPPPSPPPQKKSFLHHSINFSAESIYRKNNSNIRSDRSKLTQTMNVVGKKGVNMRILLTMQQELAAA